MIIVKLQGGLGNQMFQYAAGRSLALQNQAELILDLTFFRPRKDANYTLRNYALGVFPIKAKQSHYYWSLPYVSTMLKKTFHVKHIRERAFEFDEELAGIMGNCYLDGFWQSEHYFLANRDTILRDFSFAPGRLTGKIQIDARKIRSCNAVALHIRRGDYVNEKAVTTYVNLFEEGYYRRAIEQMEQLVKDPVFFIFSDDIGWARVHFGISGPYEFMEPPAAGDYQDLYLMSLCKHHIIANSSFSWWGAWLCNTPGQVVIAPQKWFLNPAIKTDIIPARWISL